MSPSATPSSSTNSLFAHHPPFTAISDSSSPSVSDLQFPSPPSVAPDAPSINGNELDTLTSTTSSQHSDVDPQILEALRSKDRIYVLKLGELMENLINDRRARFDLVPATSYQRLLVHRCSAYYKLYPESDPASKGIIVLSTAESRIPSRRLCDLVPAESTAQPAFKIMRRSLQERRPKSHSQPDSVAGDDVDLSDVEPSEAGSLGGRSNATGGSNKKRMTIEEREAAYNEARSRIFMGFEEKEKEKEKDMSASSSSLSLVSGSASTSGGGGSSAGDIDDSASSPATESEWSGPSVPNSRDKKDSRHLSGNASSSSSSRSLRSSAPPFSANGPGSSRNSRAPSPAFTYATLYEPPPSGPAYDHSQHPTPHGYHPSQYLYPYSPPGQPLNPYIAPYPYYPPYGQYQSPPQSASDPSTPSSAELYPPLQHAAYGNPYMWPPPNQPPLQSPPQMQQHPSQIPSQQPHQNTNHVTSPPAVQYQSYLPPSQAYPYPMSGYYTPQPGQHIEQPLPHPNAQSMYDIPRAMNGSMVGNHVNHGNPHSIGGRGNGLVSSLANGRASSRNVGSIGVINGGGKARGMTSMPQARSPWSYGPGIGMGGFTTPMGPAGGEVVGPRLSSTRRQSGNSVGSSGNSRPSSNCDDVSSTASSSTTSSSSRRTYTSTTSSQHPLPPRPDWAVGLKPQPTLHSTQARHHDHSLTNSRTMSPISPPRTLNGGSSHSNVAPPQPSSQHTPPATLQSTDFPPLISLVAAPEKRTPVIAGAWGNSTSTRSIRLPSPGHPTSPGNALVHHASNNTGAGNTNASDARLEEPDQGFERPPPKSAELYNPKVLRRHPVNGKPSGEKEKEHVRGDAVASAILVGQVASMSFEEESAGSSPVTAPREPAFW